ncbi:niban-like protein 2 isoform X2 [Rhinatrema bivittatum]|nr:niban-like protein 2 isoform X2 [Rhinatrema bivittatum]
MPYYRRQLALAFLRQVHGELEPPGKHGLQLLQNKLCKNPDGVLHEGFLLHYEDKADRWTESYVTVRGDFSLEWFRYREVLSNVAMQDLVPWLQTQLPPAGKDALRKKKGTCFPFLQEVYGLVLEQVSAELRVYQEEETELRRQLEKKIRPDLDQMLTLKAQISGKMQAMVYGAARSLCDSSVEPALDYVIEELLEPITSGFEEVRSLFASRIDRIIGSAQNHPSAVLQEVFNLTEMPWNSVLMQQCYEKATLFLDGLHGLGDRFGFHSVAGLVLRAQNLMQELMENLVFTFQHLSNLHVKCIVGTPEVIRALEKVKGRVFKKFDCDSSAIRKRFTQEALVQIFLPFLLQRLEPSCKLELPRYETYVFADCSSVVSVENIYEEIVLDLLQEAIGKGLKEASGRSRYNLYSDSFVSVFGSSEDLPGHTVGLAPGPRPGGRGGEDSPGSEGNPAASGDGRAGSTPERNRAPAGAGGPEDGVSSGSFRTAPRPALPGSGERAGPAPAVPSGGSARRGPRSSGWTTRGNLHVPGEAEGADLRPLELDTAERQLLLDGLSSHGDGSLSDGPGPTGNGLKRPETAPSGSSPF